MGRVMKKGVSAILLFALVLTGCFAGLRLIAEAEVLVNVNITFEVSTTNVTNEPDNYGISYTLNDGDAAQNGTLNFKNDEF